MTSNTYTTVGGATFVEGEAYTDQQGISLTIDQYKNFIQSIPQINANLKKKGIEVGPIEEAEVNAEEAEAEEEEEEEEEAEAEETDLEADKKSRNKNKNKKVKPAAKRGKGKKENIEATSDEEE